jgi:hypothetical protein
MSTGSEVSTDGWMYSWINKTYLRTKKTICFSSCSHMHLYPPQYFPDAIECYAVRWEGTVRSLMLACCPYSHWRTELCRLQHWQQNRLLCLSARNILTYFTPMSVYITPVISRCLRNAYERSLMDRQCCCIVAVFPLECFLHLVSFMVLYTTPLINKICPYNTKNICHVIEFLLKAQIQLYRIEYY